MIREIEPSDADCIRIRRTPVPHGNNVYHFYKTFKTNFYTLPDGPPSFLNYKTIKLNLVQSGFCFVTLETTYTNQVTLDKLMAAVYSEPLINRSQVHLEHQHIILEKIKNIFNIIKI